MSEADRSAPPSLRLRRLRRTEELRRSLSETELDPTRLIYPVFVRPGGGAPEPIESLPGIDRQPLEGLGDRAREWSRDGVRAVLLFGAPRIKDPEGSGAVDPDGLIPQAVRALRQSVPTLTILTDVCLCAYTDHGQCGRLRDGEVDNDATVERLARMALVHARAGADIVAPSAMMDHQVREIRAALDGAGLTATAILAYAAKFASPLYGPFREAAGSAPKSGDRRSYQLPIGNAREALRELAADAAEGADLLMVKPGLPYLDILARARRRFDLPLVAYQVSGEYAMIRAAAARGWIDEAAVIDESLLAMRRAGADWIITYFAREVAARARRADR
ncbi:MAG: porphobilinogen synthase [Thermoplasmata archaeon]|jgi:porphobilinogen synthase